MNGKPISIEDRSTATEFSVPKDHFTDLCHEFPLDRGTPQHSVGHTIIHETRSSGYAQFHPHVRYTQGYPPASSTTPIQETLLATCTIRSGLEDRECGIQFPPTRASLAAHLRTIHYVQQVKLTRTRLAGDPLITCPEEACHCRFYGRTCAIQPTETVQHRTHVVDLLRHCMDKHLRMPQRASIQCAHCGQSFTRRESLTRHVKRGCPNVRTAHSALCTN
jgi:hypothetical protein